MSSHFMQSIVHNELIGSCQRCGRRPYCIVLTAKNDRLGVTGMHRFCFLANVLANFPQIGIQTHLHTRNAGKKAVQ
jgi:hypothetical protein